MLYVIKNFLYLMIKRVYVPNNREMKMIQNYTNKGDQNIKVCGCCGSELSLVLV